MIDQKETNQKYSRLKVEIPKIRFFNLFNKILEFSFKEPSEYFKIECEVKLEKGLSDSSPTEPTLLFGLIWYCHWPAI